MSLGLRLTQTGDFNCHQKSLQWYSVYGLQWLLVTDWQLVKLNGATLVLRKSTHGDMFTKQLGGGGGGGSFMCFCIHI